MAHVANLRCAWLPKAGRSAEEYEDAFRPCIAGAYPLGLELRCAVADGATESSFARLWARQLVRVYCNGATPLHDAAGFRQKVEQQCARWMHYVFAKPLAWNFQAKAQRGAFATLAGILLTRGEDGAGRWDAWSVGDSCLFQLRTGELIHAFPSLQAADFGFHPQLLCSIAGANESIWAEFDQHAATGEWAAGDQFLLMTDALGRWFAEGVENGSRPWEALLAASSAPEMFAQWVAERRDAGEMNNDDVTLLALAIEENA